MIEVNAEIIAVGSELLTPTKVDTNSLWLTDQLNALGVEVVSKSIIGDDRVRLTEAVRSAAARSHIVFITGGLGPTEDDVTRDAVATALGRGQSFQEDLFDRVVAARFRRLNRPIAENNRRQGFLIDGAEPLDNDRGTAPGQWIEAGDAVVVLLPGPPREMKAMFELQCLPRLQRMLPEAVIRTRLYRVVGIGESDLDQLIAPVYTKYLNPATTILAAPGDIQVHLRARCSTLEEGDALLAELGSQVELLLGDRIYSATGNTLEAVVGALLKERGETISVAESITGGGLGERLTRVPGSSGWFVGGYITYNNDMKTRLLGVNPDLLTEHTAVSEPVVRAMAYSVRKSTGSTWGLAVSGYADQGTSESMDHAGVVFIALSSPSGEQVQRVQFGGDRERVRNFTSIWALDQLRKAILSRY